MRVGNHLGLPSCPAADAVSSAPAPRNSRLDRDILSNLSGIGKSAVEQLATSRPEIGATSPARAQVIYDSMDVINTISFKDKLLAILFKRTDAAPGSP